MDQAFQWPGEGVLYDHLPHKLFEDDYSRVCQIPRRKGANFRDLPGLIVGDDNTVRRDPATEVLLPSGKPTDCLISSSNIRIKHIYVTGLSQDCGGMRHCQQFSLLQIATGRYRQIGNAVPIPVGRALGYAMGMAYQKLAGRERLMKLPPNFAYSHTL